MSLVAAFVRPVMLVSAVMTVAAAQSPSTLRALQGLDARVADVAFALATANAGQCPQKSKLTGLALHSLGQYGPAKRAEAKTVFGFGQFPVVLGVARDSPAARAGLRVDDQILAVNGTSLAETAGRTASVAGVERARALIDAATARGSARLSVRRGTAVFERTMTAVTGCASHVEMIPSNKRNAVADGLVVQLTSGIVSAAQGDDELAFVIGHELAHNISGHYDWLRANKRTKANIRKTEIEADELGVAMMARAGYDPYAASRFWARFGGGLGGGLLSDGTHMRDGERTVFLRQVANRVSTQGTQ